MRMGENYPAKPEYATAPIAVWWDIKDCPIPEEYDARRVRPSIEEEFKKLGYNGPVSITTYGDLKQTPDHVLRGLTSSGVTVAHSIPQNIYSAMYSDILEWRAHNPPPATMMLISDHVDKFLSWDLARLQQVTYYNVFRAYSFDSMYFSNLLTEAEWLWKNLLESSSDETTSGLVTYDAMYCCKSCSFDCQSLKTFKKHLSSKKHVLEEIGNCGNGELDPVTRMWGRNYMAKPEYATANIGVWWNMEHCPIPQGYDACHVRSSIEMAFKKLGYSGSVSIHAYDDQKQTSDHVLQGLSSTGVHVSHSIPEKRIIHMFSDMLSWQNQNPPPATMMLISNQVEEIFSHVLARTQQQTKYNFFMAYSFRPYKMSVLVTSAEWLWDTLLAHTGTQVVQKCSESSGMFYCKLCHFDCNGLDHFKKHLTSNEHSRTEGYVHSNIRYKERQQKLLLEEQTFPKRKRLRKATSYPGLRARKFCPLRNHLHLTNRGTRRRAQKSQTSKKE